MRSFAGLPISHEKRQLLVNEMGPLKHLVGVVFLFALDEIQPRSVEHRIVQIKRGDDPRHEDLPTLRPSGQALPLPNLYDVVEVGDIRETLKRSRARRVRVLRQYPVLDEVPLIPALHQLDLDRLLVASHQGLQPE